MKLRTSSWSCSLSSPMMTGRSPRLSSGERNGFTLDIDGDTVDTVPCASRPASSSSFGKRVVLSGEDVLVAICEPVPPWTIFAKSPAVDTWYLGVIDLAGEIRPIG